MKGGHAAMAHQAVGIHEEALASIAPTVGMRVSSMLNGQGQIWKVDPTQSAVPVVVNIQNEQISRGMVVGHLHLGASRNWASRSTSSNNYR
jgi:hypothetical protein